MVIFLAVHCTVPLGGLLVDDGTQPRVAVHISGPMALIRTAGGKIELRTILGENTGHIRLMNDAERNVVIATGRIFCATNTGESNDVSSRSTQAD